MDENTARVVDRIVTTLGKISVTALVSGFLYLSVKELAGKETLALIDATVSHGGGINLALFGTTGLASIWAIVERRLRKAATERFTDRIIGLEKKIDPGRSSSGLSRDGTTHPRDT